MTERPTPETDAIAKRIAGGGDITRILNHIAELTEHARSLERQLSLAREQRDIAMGTIEEAPHHRSCCSVRRDYASLLGDKCDCWKADALKRIAEVK